MSYLSNLLKILNDSIKDTLKQIQRTLLKSQFWQRFSNLDLHEGQRKS